MVFKEGVTLASKHLVIRARPNELNFNRLGLCVARKVGKAVTRNRVKRLLREAMRNLVQGFTLNYDFVIVARRSSAENKMDDFIRDIKRFMVKITEVNSLSPGRVLALKQSQNQDSTE